MHLPDPSKNQLFFQVKFQRIVESQFKANKVFLQIWFESIWCKLGCYGNFRKVHINHTLDQKYFIISGGFLSNLCTVNSWHSMEANTSFWISEMFGITKGKATLIYFFKLQIHQHYRCYGALVLCRHFFVFLIYPLVLN